MTLHEHFPVRVTYHVKSPVLFGRTYFLLQGVLIFPISGGVIGCSTSYGTVQYYILAQLKMNMTPWEATAARMKFDEDFAEKCYNAPNALDSVFGDSYNIVSLSSGENESEDEEQDLLRAKTVGQEKSTVFIEDRIKHANVSFCDLIRNNLKKSLWF